MYSDHFQSLAPDFEVARASQSGWSGGQHLPAHVQEMCSPHIMSVLHSLLSSECSNFDLDSGSVSMVRARVERPSISHASGGSPPISPFAADAPITARPVPAPHGIQSIAGVSQDNLRAKTSTFEDPTDQNTTKIPREDTWREETRHEKIHRERKKNENGGGRRKKKREILGGPAEERSGNTHPNTPQHTPTHPNTPQHTPGVVHTIGLTRLA